MTQSIELKFSRGVFVPGTITEAVSGKPAAGALVQYAQTTKNNPLLQRGGLPHSEAVSDSAGKFQIVVPAGPGHLLVRAANSRLSALHRDERGAGNSNPCRTRSCTPMRWLTSISSPAQRRIK